MAIRRGFAWLTCVTRDDTLTSALVLVESLRRTRTTRRIGVIISENVSKDGALILRKNFDDVFLLDNNLVPKANLENGARDQDDELRGKIFAFSLELYDKCIFMVPNTLFLENYDKLFDEGDEMVKNLSGNWDMFRFRPSLALCEFLQTNPGSRKSRAGRSINEKDGFWKCINAWLENNDRKWDELNDLMEGPTDESPIMKFSVETGNLMLTGLDYDRPFIAQFIDVPNNDIGLVAKLTSYLKDPGMGRSEKIIIQEWLKIFDERVARIMVDPTAELSTWKNNRNKQVYKNEPIAIVGMSCRFPGANNLEEFWNLLYSGVEGIREPPAFRWRKEHSIYGGSGKERKTNAGFLSVPIDEFDAKFFGISPKEATFLDPQARLLHEVLWESLENGGIDPMKLRGSHTGIFTGSWMSDYKDIVQTSTERDFFRTYLGNSMGAVSARLSFLLGLTGPSVATESGCSSAIVAVDLAVKSLRSGESNLALAGGVNLLLHPFQNNIIDFVVAPNGRCKTFDEMADGFGRAEGCGVLVLKRLSDALRDRDNIWAIIRGSAISQEGISRSLGTPTVHCEALAMELAMKNAEVFPEQVSFVETHGTGTAVGDPMEVAAIAKAYNSKARKEPLIIGSVKTNVGHTESCSGITGIIKTVLAMQHQLIPKHLNLETLNPEVKLDAIPAKIPMESITWPKVQDQPRIAGVSSFGITGTDGHVIIEEAPDYNLPKFSLGLERPLHLIKFSGKTNEALEDLLKLYKESFQQRKSDQLFCDMAFTANTGRASFGHRAFLLASTYEDAIQEINSKKLIYGDTTGKEPGPVCFLFTGQGSQYPGMAQTLYETSPVFRLYFDQCDKILREDYNLSILSVLWSSQSRSKEVSRTINSQTSIFCVEYCLLKLWQSWGIKPDMVLGHSLGEFCATVAAGILSFEDALRLVVERSRLIENLPRGSMLVVRSSLMQVEEVMKKSSIDLDIAAVNSMEQTVVAGDIDNVNELLDVCKKHEIKASILESSHAFHSRHMDPMLEKYRDIAKTIHYRKNTNCKYISGMEGKLIDNPSANMNADYWVRHAREKVSFLDACKTLKEFGCEHFVEIGPQPVLSSFILQNIEISNISCYPSLRRKSNDWETILTSLGKLYLQGFTVDWDGFDKPYTRKKIPQFLPFHPFYRKSFWADCSETSISPIHPLIGSPFKNASNLSIFQNILNLKSVPYLRDHCIGNRIILPGAAFTEMCMSAGYCVSNALTDLLEKPRRPLALENLRIDLPLELKEGKNCRLQVIVDFEENDLKRDSDDTHSQHGFRAKVYRQNNADNESTGKWILHSSSTFHAVANTKDILSKLDSERIRSFFEKEILPTRAFYKRIDGVGIKFGETFRSLDRYWGEQGDNEKDEIVAEMKVPKDHESYLLHPIIIDAMLQTRILTLRRTQSEALSVPVRIGKLVWLDNISNESQVLYLHAKWEDTENCFIFVLNENLTPVAFMSDVELIETNVKTIESILEQQNSTLPDCWEEIWKPIPGPLDNRAELPHLEPIIINDDFKKRMEVATNLVPEDWDYYKIMNRLVYLYTLKVLDTLGWKPIVGETVVVKDFCVKHKILPMHCQLVHFYFTMFQKENGMIEFNESEDSWLVKSSPPCVNEIQKEIDYLFGTLKDVDKVSVVSNAHHSFGERLPKLLRGEESALSLLFPTDSALQGLSADSYYQNHPGRPDSEVKTVESLGSIIRAMREVNIESPKKVLRVLEVGAGTGVMSRTSLNLINDIWGSKFEYYFTDISAAFFAKAEKRFEDFKGNLKFCVFDIEFGGLEQGIPLHYFDLVLAADVIHATKSLSQSVQHLRETLRPGGTIFFSETLCADRGSTFMFGLLEGYWKFTDYEVRSRHCCVGEDTWRKILLQTGFTFTHVIKGYMDTVGLIIGEASRKVPYNKIVENLRVDEERKEWIVFGCEGDAIYPKLISTLSNVCASNVTLVLPNDIHDHNSDDSLKNVSTKYINPQSEDSAELDSILGKDNLHAIVYAWGMDIGIYDQKKIALPLMHIAKKVLTLKKPPKLYVLTRGIHEATETHVTSNPSASTLFGMTKSLKNENSDMFVRYVDLEGRYDEDTIVNEILFELAMNKEAREKDRVQVVYRDSQRYEPRYNRAKVQRKRDDLQLPPSTDRYQLVLPKSRMMNDLEYDVLEEETVKEDEVEVRVGAYSLNFKDVLTILKPSEKFENMNAVGLDFAGIVTKVGEKVNPEMLKVGDRVFALNTKEVQLPSHLTIEAENVLRVPKNMTLAEASTLPAVFATSYHCLVNVGKMKAGETVLIHTGSGGVGLSSIQIARHVGTNIITTAGSPRKRAYLRSLGLKHVFHSRDTSYQEEIMKVTNGRGVDIVLNSITGPGFKEATLSVCAKNARFVEMSKLSVWTNEEVKERRPDVQYTLVDLTNLDRSEWSGLTDSMKKYLNEGYVKPIPYVQFDALKIRQAFQYFQKAKHIGKLIVTMPEVRTKQGQWSVDVTLFNGDSTYLISGGLGGIGFEVCKWMLRKGATDIILIGRNPPKPEVAKEIERLNNDQKYNIAVKLGDVGDYDQCKAIIEDIKTSGAKPIRGIQHCAGVLRDNMYANQTWESFEATFRAKVDGTWNLHNLTKDMQLEHFVLYSSITALAGTPSQANHSAANTFEDAFAHFRYCMGLPATTINWGQWAQVGVAKEISLPGILPVSVKRMLNGLELALRSHRLQTTFAEFDSLNLWSTAYPLFKGYMDESILKSIKDGDGQSQIILKSDEFWQEMDEAETKEEKMEVVAGCMKAILRSALRMDPDEPISEDANMRDLGVDSLMLIELKNSIQTLLGSRLTVTANMLKDCNTIRDLATVIVNKIMDDEESSAKIPPLSPEEFAKLLEADCVLEDAIQPSYPAPESVDKIETLLITGVTGQLGPYILSTLCQPSYCTVQKIICLIRTKEGKCPQEKLQNILESMHLKDNVDVSKVECIRGDVTQPYFGLSGEEYEKLCNSVGGVIHLAVKSNHVEAYRKCEKGTRDIRSVNVGGTLNVLRFAATGTTKQIYYSSGIVSVFGGNDEDTLSDEWPEESQITIVAENNIVGYPASKYVCEMLLKQANDRGIPCKVFRFPWIMGESKTGQLNYMNNHYILRFLSYLKLKSMPIAPIPALVLPVDICAELSLKIFWNGDAPNEIYNISHPQPEMEMEFAKVAKQDFGIEVELVDWRSTQFAEKLYAHDMPLESLKEIYEDVDRAISISTSDAFQSIQGYLRSPDNFFRNKKLEKFLPGYTERIKSSMDIIRSDLAYVKSKGFFDKFGL